MTSRERVRAVLHHQLPDRVPNGLGGCETEGLHIVAYDKLQNVLGLERKPPRMDTFMTNAVFEEPVIRAMDGDIILLASPNMCASELRGNDIADQWKEQKLWGRTFSVPVRERFCEREDGSIIWETRGNAVNPAGTYFFDHAGVTDLFADFQVPDPDQFNPRDTLDDRMLRRLEDAAKRLYEETDLSICLGETICDLQIAPGGMIGSMILMKEEPDVMRALLDKCTDAALKQIALLEQAVGKYVDILSIAHDLGDNRCVTIGAPLWREIYKPYYKKLFTGWRKITDMKVNLHSCGSISAIISDLIECGMQVLNPVQTSAADMSPAFLKERFGKDIVFWGGAYDAQLIPESASYEEVYRTVYDNVKILGEDGGFIFSGVHNLPATIPESHLAAMLDAYRAARAY
ncbi:MAG: hypothetical protein IJC71_02725 [Clostridia bacterium]|nr:hypothetical protein [Clostridia bacterium]